MQTVSNCSAPCGGGVRNVTYARTCSNPPPSCGGATCSGSNTSDVQEVCNTQFCPVDGGWSDWYKEYNSSCSVTCGGGQMNVTYIRFCDNPPPQYGGKDCEGDNTTTITVPCNTQKCPVDGGWSTWKAEDSGRCSVTCGGGQKNVTNKRHCDSPEPQYGGQDCAGDDIKVITESCNTSPCPMTCGAGVMNVTYRRTCDNPAPQFGGNTCTGGKKRTRIAACVAPPCLVAGGKREWGMWSDVGECSALCGGGHLQRTREGKCDNSDPAYGDCIGVVKETETVVCNDGDCGDRCPENNVTSIPQPTNDHLYYLCDNGVAVLTSCGVGHVWSQQNSTCVIRSLMKSIPLDGLTEEEAEDVVGRLLALDVVLHVAGVDGVVVARALGAADLSGGAVDTQDELGAVLVGQGTAMISVWLPWQSSPPSSGGGLSHCRSLRRLISPPPQRALHSSTARQAPHLPHWPPGDTRGSTAYPGVDVTDTAYPGVDVTDTAYPGVDVTDTAYPGVDVTDTAYPGARGSATDTRDTH
ncbi:hypothetical protein C0Q70_18375 [Pomacea canaliculata]|uniref:Chitin-binding type-2 domain-containing protein n=1 Tax=Pomacea canaliculata TaxID=400727 RepID=A0A2T7NN06_POMCA|nr:hypothetical protein C0Q70_18375 [Pomacea canaliculata]